LIREVPGLTLLKFGKSNKLIVVLNPEAIGKATIVSGDCFGSDSSGQKRLVKAATGVKAKVMISTHEASIV
jgi:hypothetical protein